MQTRTAKGGKNMVSKAFSMGLFGMHAFKVEVECDLSAGLPAFDLVGLPDAAVKESRNRVRAALKNCGFDFPVSRITMNLAPADVRKEGPVYDLPLLIALLKATGQLNVNTDDCIFAGELSLSGKAIATSGSYEIYYDASRRHHHLINPASGFSPAVGSVSVVAGTAMEADTLATALSILPPTDALKLVQGLPGRECYILSPGGCIYTSPGWASFA